MGKSEGRRGEEGNMRRGKGRDLAEKQLVAIDKPERHFEVEEIGAAGDQVHQVVTPREIFVGVLNGVSLHRFFCCHLTACKEGRK